MDACPRYLCTCVYVIVCMSARKKAPVNLLMCPMFIGVSMHMSRNAGHHEFNFLQFTLLEHVVLVWEYIVAADLKQVPRSF